MTGFSHEAFCRVWAELDDETRAAIRRRAGSERRTLSAVMEQWWPDLWRRVVHPDAELTL